MGTKESVEERGGSASMYAFKGRLDRLSYREAGENEHAEKAVLVIVLKNESAFARERVRSILGNRNSVTTWPE